MSEPAACQHCGQAHVLDETKCSVTGALMGASGVIGKRVDRYQVERLLGVGGFGTVYRARHVHTDATVALKLLKRELNADQTMIDRFLREAKAASAVGSEHIVGVLDAGVAADGQAFLVLEFLDGWDLKDLVYREGPQSPQRLVEIVLQALDGLAAAHAKGVVHRDMKPANVFIVLERWMLRSRGGRSTQAGSDDPIAAAWRARRRFFRSGVLASRRQRGDLQGSRRNGRRRRTLQRPR